MALLKVDNLIKRFGGLTAVDGISFRVEPGEIYGLIGPNGSGKTTLFNLICNQVSPDDGTICFDGRDITGWPPHRICRLGIGRTFQVLRPAADMTVFDAVLAAAFSRTGSPGTARTRTREHLDFCGLRHRQTTPAGALPTGERKRLEMARALATDPKLLLLDETASGLNAAECDAAVSLIRKIRNLGVAVILVEHVMPVVMALSDRVHAIGLGRTLAEGPPSAVAGHPAVVDAYLGRVPDGW